MKKSIFTLISLLFLSIFIKAQSVIIPKPLYEKEGEGYFIINNKTAISSNEKNQFNLKFLKSKLTKATKYAFNDDNNYPVNNIILNLNPYSPIENEGYILSVVPSEIKIEASTSAGIYYGIQSLLQMMPPSIYSGVATNSDEWRVKSVTIKDSPRYSYRGMMLDVSRTFFDVETVKQYIEWLSYHKINRFHWHLTDDNGWRIEIKKYPLLTSMGAWRGDNEVLSPAYGSGKERYGGFYTQNEIKEVVKFAADRHIEIVPEIELPGHSKAVTATYNGVACNTNNQSLSVQGEGNNVWCVGNEDNYKMLDNIIREISKLFPGEYIHIGGDEVNYTAWENCPLCKDLKERMGLSSNQELQNYFVKRVEKIVEKYGKKMAGWDEILDGGHLSKDTRVYAWRNLEKGEESVSKEQPTIFMPGAYCYFDMKYSPLERGHNWAGIVSTQKTYSINPGDSKYAIGVQGGLWAELLGYPNRFVEYQTYPKLVALAEVGWTPQSQRDWDDFKIRLEKYHYNRMANMGISFRLPYPEVNYLHGALRVTLPYEWAVVRYTSDESEPTALSPVYRGEIYTDKPEKYRFTTFFKDDIKSITVSASNVDYNYQKPAVEIVTNLEEGKYNLISFLTDYEPNTYFRTVRKLKAGDYVSYIFKEPIKSNRITIETGMPKIDFYWVTDGYVEYTYNGTHFIKGPQLHRGAAIIYPTESIKAVRVIITAPNDGHVAVFRDLKVE